MARVSRKMIAPETARPAPARLYRTAVYLRLSQEDIRKKISDSIGTQRALLEDFIRRNPDLRLQGIYQDVNYTGANFNRPGFAHMIQDMQAGLVDCVVVKDLSRLGRNFRETGHYLERVFPPLGVRFIAVGDGYDSLTATLEQSGLIVPLKNLMNEAYARDISRKISSSIRLRQQRGQFVGSVAPYGYLRDGTTLAVDEEAAVIVRLIFGWALEGHSDIAIAGMLNQRKVPPPGRYRFEKGIAKEKSNENAKFWYKSAVKRICENIAYTGMLAQGKARSDFLSGGGRVEKEREAWILVPDSHPAIIDEYTFEAVGEMRDARRGNYGAGEKPASATNRFKGLLVCGDCGGSMSRHRRRHAGGETCFFQCNTYAQVDKTACKKKKIMEGDIQAALFAYIGRELRLAPDMCRILSEAQSEAIFRGQSITDKQIAALRNKQQRNRRLRGSLREKYKDGALAWQEYTRAKADCERERERLGRELEALLCGKHRETATPSPDDKWTAELMRFENEGQLSAGMMAALVERIQVYDSDRVHITLRHRDEFEALLACIVDPGQKAWVADA